MAVSVDTVYQRVLALANKEQRGYITPQEFNLLANQAQMTIFEQYFYDKNQRDRNEPDPDHHTDEGNISKLIDQKLKPFSSFQSVTNGVTFPTTITVGGQVLEIFHYGNIVVGSRYLCKYMERVDLENIKRSARHQTYNQSFDPIWTDSYNAGQDIEVYNNKLNQVTSGVTVECFRIPKTVNWGYVVVRGIPLYNSNVAVNFELHRSEEDTLVNKILEMAGIVINKPGLANLAQVKDQSEKTLQKI